MFFGIAAIIGAGSFSSLGEAIYKGGPGVILLYIICGVSCCFTALCYAEFASRIPTAGSAYTYAYATFGELAAWIIGWMLIMEYSFGNIYVAFSWSDYFTSLLDNLGLHIPEYLSCSYTEAEKAAVRTKYQLPERFVLNVGAIEPRKNALEIVKAIAPLQDLSLVLVGAQTAYYQQIRNYAQQHHMEHRVQALTGVTMEELAIIYQLSEVFCYPSVFEGFGIPIIEALFSGVPVITTQGSCFPEAGGEGSIYISLDNAADEIREAIQRISSDRVLREEMIEKGYAHAQHFTDEAVYQQLMAVYKKIEQL